MHWEIESQHAACNVMFSHNTGRRNQKHMRTLKFGTTASRSIELGQASFMQDLRSNRQIRTEDSILPYIQNGP